MNGRRSSWLTWPLAALTALLVAFAAAVILLAPVVHADEAQVMLLLGVLTLGIGQLIKLVATERAASRAELAASEAHEAKEHVLTIERDVKQIKEQGAPVEDADAGRRA